MVDFLNWQLALDYNDLMRIPVVNDFVRQSANDTIRVRYVSTFYDCMVYLLPFRNGRGHGHGHQASIPHKDRVWRGRGCGQTIPIPFRKVLVNLFGLLSIL